MKSRNSGVLYFVAGLLVATIAIGGIYLSDGFRNGVDTVTPKPTNVTRRSETISPTATMETTNTTTQPGGSSPNTNLSGSNITDINEEYPIKVKCTGDLQRGSLFRDLVGECSAYEGPGASSFYSRFSDCIEDPAPPIPRDYLNSEYFICRGGSR